MMTMPLEGIRVIEWTIWQQGPACGAMLGDLGAEVIKIESRDGGDPGRGLMKLNGIDLSGLPDFYFEANNRNKKSITLDLKKKPAQEIVYQLIESADVFLHNFRKGVPERLSLDYETLRKHNPKLVYACASGFGPEGPDSGDPAYDQLGLARSGIMTAMGEPDMEPISIAGGIADQMGAIGLAYGVLAALTARELHGVGQRVDASQLGSMTMLQGLNVSFALTMGRALPRVERKTAVNPLWNHYRCADDRWIILGMPQSDRFWPDFCETIGHSELVKHKRFCNMQARSENALEAIAILDSVFATKPLDRWLEIFGAGDFVVSGVNSIEALIKDPQVLANHYVAEFDHPNFGNIQVPGIPIQFSETPARLRDPAPALGQHTEQVLMDVLGLSWDKITEMRNNEVI
jgi:crotonobetainyl-CoA:carnitine CoA-transferase CaiB-like acyl-CoA transferase